MRPSRWILVGLLVAVVVGIGATRAIGAQHDDQQMGEVVRVTPTADPDTTSPGTSPRQPGSSPAGSGHSTSPAPSKTSPSSRAKGDSTSERGDNGPVDRSTAPRNPASGAPQVSHQPPAAGDDDDDDDDHWDSDDDDEDDDEED